LLQHSQGRPASAIAEADVPEGNGSGIVWDASGHIVTNFHVLQVRGGEVGVHSRAWRLRDACASFFTCCLCHLLVLQSALAKFGSSPNAALGSSSPNPAVGKKVALITLQVGGQGG
jgi:hypothetical protein